MILPASLWMALPDDGFDVLEYDSAGGLPRWFGELHKRARISDWGAPVTANWCAKKPGRRPEIAVFGLSSQVCATPQAATAVFGPCPRDIEWLNVDADGDQWWMLNCLRRVQGFDAETSIFDWMVHIPFEPIISSVRWVNIIDPQALSLEIFTLDHCEATSPYQSRQLFWTESLVRRVQGLGPSGIAFRHVGYVVSDASQAIPMPPVPPPAATRKRRGPQLIATPLHADDAAELAQAGASLRATLQISAQTDASAVLGALTQHVTQLRYGWPQVDAPTRTQTLLGLSAIYGDLLCAAQGWTWIELRQGRKQSWLAVASADGQYALALMPFMDMQVMSEAPTLTLLFNMIAAGHLPPAEPGRIALVG